MTLTCPTFCTFLPHAVPVPCLYHQSLQSVPVSTFIPIIYLISTVLMLKPLQSLLGSFSSLGRWQSPQAPGHSLHCLCVHRKAGMAGYKILGSVSLTVYLHSVTPSVPNVTARKSDACLIFLTSQVTWPF